MSVVCGCRKTIKAEEVIHEQPVQVVEEHTVNLPAPGAQELLEPVLTVTFDRQIFLPGKAIIQGTIRKNIIYKELNTGLVKHFPTTIPFLVAKEVPGLLGGIVIGQRFIPDVGIEGEKFVTNLRAFQFLVSPTKVEQKVVLDFILKVSQLSQLDVCTVRPAPVFDCRAELPCVLRPTC